MKSSSAVLHVNKAHGDDAFLRRNSGAGYLDAVFDGVSEGDGAAASSFVKKFFAEKSFSNVTELGGALFNVNRKLWRQYISASLTPLTTIAMATRYSVVEDGKQQDKLNVITCGDSPVYLWRESGELVYSSHLDNYVDPKTFEVDSDLLTQCIGDFLHGTFRPHNVDLDLYQGDRLFLGTDGVTDNISPAEIYRKCVAPAETPAIAIRNIGRELERKEGLDIGLGSNVFKPDDQTAIIRYFK